MIKIYIQFPSIDITSKYEEKRKKQQRHQPIPFISAFEFLLHHVHGRTFFFFFLQEEEEKRIDSTGHCNRIRDLRREKKTEK